MNGAFLTFLRNSAKALLIGAIRGYQLVISPGLPGRCKFYPSCSHYALDAVKEYGAARGFILASWRVLRCNPLSHGGYDPVSYQKLFAPRGPQSQGVQVRGALPSPPALPSSPALPRPNGLGG